MEQHPPTLPQDSPPSAQPPRTPDSDVETAKAVFDTVGGPNWRLSDNLIQLAAIVIGTLVGAGIGLLLVGDPLAGLLVGGFVGLVASLLLSGLVIGIVRFVLAFRRR